MEESRLRMARGRDAEMHTLLSALR